MKRAIVLAGGGTKGSYEVGVWRALNELGIDYQIVTGTSIGSINGVFMAAGEYERAYTLWDTIQMENMMEDGINLTETLEGMLEQKDSIRPFLKKYMKNKGADISPFNAFIETMVDEEKLRESEVDFGLVTTQFPSLKGVELAKKEIPQGMLKDYLLASSAVFPLFPMHKIGEETYLDGCYYDNLPIDFAIRLGAEEVIAVDLKVSPVHANYTKRPYVTYIRPTRSLGTMMNFDHTLLMDNMEMGYQDAMKKFGRYDGFLYTFFDTDFGAWDREIAAFSRWIAKAEAVFSGGRLSKLAGAPDIGAVFLELEAYTDGKMPEQKDYFIRGAEIAAEIFGIDVKRTWKFKEFLQDIRDAVRPEDACADVKIFQTNSRRTLLTRLAEWKRKGESTYVASCIYYAMCSGMAADTVKIGLLTIFPRELIAALFLYVQKEEEERNRTDAYCI